jgi:rhodanese-related sulfurtransferase
MIPAARAGSLPGWKGDAEMGKHTVSDSMRRLLRISPAILWIVVFGVAASSASTDVRAISAREFKAMIDDNKNNPDVVTLDIRTPKEYRQGHIQGAQLIDFYASDFEDQLKRLDRNRTYLIYCRSGNRSAKSLEIFAKLGFRQAYHLDSGLIGWVQANFSLVNSHPFSNDPFAHFWAGAQQRAWWSTGTRKCFGGMHPDFCSQEAR